MVNQFSASQGAMQRDTYIDNIDASVELLWMRRDRFAGVLSQFFNDQNADSISWRVSNVSAIVGMPRENEDTDDLPYVQSAPGFAKTFTLVPYRSAVRVTDTMILADRKNKIVAMTGGLIKSSMRRLEYFRAGIINGAFSGTSGADDLSLCNDSHPHENPEAGTWDNLGTGALTGPNLQALRLIGQNMTNEIGAPDSATILKVLIPTALEQTLEELITSTLRAQDSLNANTVLINRLQPVVSPFLTSTTAYFGFADREDEEKGLHEIYLKRPNLSNTGNNPVDIPIDKRIKFITKLGFTTSKNIIGSDGT